MTPSASRLSLVGISKTFPGIRALDNVSFDIRPGEVHGLLGENGAGKSTILNILSAVLSASEGRIIIDGQPVTLNRPSDARAAGIAMIHQELQHIPALSVAQNLFLGRPLTRAGGLLVDRRAQERRAREVLADLDPGARYDGALTTSAVAQADGWAITGRKSPVVGGAEADWIVVTAVADDGAGGLYLVAGDATGLSRRGYALMDGGEGADLDFADTPATRLGDMALLDRPVAAATLAVCADAVGVMDRVIEMTGEYLRTRQQFGKPLGQFQALAHRMADMLIEVEQARSAVINLAAHLDHPARDRYLSAAKVTVGETARLVAEDSIQMHGGIGLTQEYGLGPLVRRLLAADARFGDVDYHLERFAALSQGA